MKRIQEDIKKRAFHSVYLLYGEENYLARLYRDQITQAVLDSPDDMNYTKFQGNNLDLLEIEEIADTLPFFQDYRLIVLEDTQLFRSANEFAAYLPTMPDSTIIVFVEREVDKRNKLYKYVQKNGLAVEMKQMRAAELKKFIAAKLRGDGRKIREKTAEYFLAQVDHSLNNMDNELEKLIAYTHGREEITCGDIDAVCNAQVTGRIFQMLDAVASGNQKEMLSLYQDLLSLQESPMSILYLLARHFHILLQVKSLPTGLSRQEAAKKAGVPPFAVSKYQRQCRNFSKEQLCQMLSQCTDTEFDFKQGRISDRIGVETLLIGFMYRNRSKGR